MGGIFSSPDSSPPPAPVQAAVAPVGRGTEEKTVTRNQDSTRQRRRAGAVGTGTNTILTESVDNVAGEAKSLLGS